MAGLFIPHILTISEGQTKSFPLYYIFMKLCRTDIFILTKCEELHCIKNTNFCGEKNNWSFAIIM